MIMISYKPPREGSAHIVLPLALILCGLTAMLGAGYQKSFAPTILQTVGLVFLAASVIVINRYSTATYLYTLDEETPGLLCVHKIVGKKKTTPITADMSTAVGVRILTPEDHGRTPGARRVNMCLNLFPRKRMAILFRRGEDLTELVIETDDIFFAEIESRIE